MQLKFLWVGKTKSLPIRSLVDDYAGRLGHWVACDTVEMPDTGGKRPSRKRDGLSAAGADIEKALSGGGKLVVLDERGKEFSSVDLAGWFDREMQGGTRAIVFLIGGPEGLDAEVARGAYLRLSLGKMTWTHEMCRVLLLEQVYRAFTIIRNIPYHK